MIAESRDLIRGSRVAATALLLITTLPAAGAEPTHDCAAIEDGGARLACYDAAFPPAGKSQGAIQQDDAAPASAWQEFGLSEADLRQRDPERARRVLASIEASVTKAQRRSDGSIVLTLDNGQAWLQLERTQAVRLSPGDRIEIRRAALGSYLLVTPARAMIRVRRVR